VRQTNHEGELIDWVQQAARAGSPVVLNGAGWTHTSVALRDACALLTAPLVEVHISNVHAREEFRRHSYLSAVAAGVIVGLGVTGYALAIRWLAEHARPAAEAPPPSQDQLPGGWVWLGVLTGVLHQPHGRRDRYQMST